MQDKNNRTPEFLRRTDALKKHLTISLVEVAQWIGVSKAALFAYRAGTSPISDKVWKRLREAEARAGLAPQGIAYAEAQGSSHRVEEPKGNTAAFREYLAVLRGIREEAEKLAAGDAAKAADLFDKMLSTWTTTVAAKRRNTANPFGLVDEEAVRRARMQVEEMAAQIKGPAAPEAEAHRKQA